MNKQDCVGKINSILDLDSLPAKQQIKILDFIRDMSDNNLRRYLILNALRSERRDTYQVIAMNYGVSEDTVKKYAQSLRTRK